MTEEDPGMHDPDARSLRYCAARSVGRFGQNCWIEALFHYSCGFNIMPGDRIYLNADCIVLDSAPVTIGEGSMLGPGVHIYTADHHPEADKRRAGIERGLPVRLGRDVWIDGSAVILPGAVIGEGAIAGAGAVVCETVAAGQRVAGVPTRGI